MPEVTEISSLTNPRVKRVVKLRTHKVRRAEGVFIAEGPREVERAAAAGLAVEEVYVCPGLLGTTPGAVESYVAGLVGDAEAVGGARVYDVTEPVFRKMAYLKEPAGVLAVCVSPAWSLDELVLPEDALLLVAVGTEKPGNLGAMARTAAAAGCAAVLATGPVDAMNPNAIRSSTGAVFTLPIIAASDAELQDFLHARDIPVYAATPHNAKDHAAVALRGRCAVVIGPEDTGLDDTWLAAADACGERITIPMPGSDRGGIVDSLNASNAAAIVLFEAVRQRRGG